MLQVRGLGANFYYNKTGISFCLPFIFTDICGHREAVAPTPAQNPALLLGLWELWGPTGLCYLFAHYIQKEK